MGTSVQPETDEQIVDRLIAAGATDEEIVSILQEVRGGSATQRFFRGLGAGAKSAMGMLASPGVMGPGVRPSVTREQIEKEQAQFQARRPTPEQLGTAGKIGEFVGEVGATAPLSGALGGLFGNLGRARVESVVGPAAKSASKLGAFLRGAAAGTPGNVAAGVATEVLLRPEETLTPMGIARTAAYSTLGGLFDGFFGVSALNKANKVSAVEGLAQEAAQARMSPEAAQAFMLKLDDFLGKFENLANDPFTRLPGKVKPEIEIPEMFRSRTMPPVKGRVPNSPDVQGYLEELAADIAQRQELAKQIITRINNMKNPRPGDVATHTAQQIAALTDLTQQFDKLSLKISADVERLGLSAEQVRNLRVGGVEGARLGGAPAKAIPSAGIPAGTSRTVIRTVGQEAPNMKNVTQPPLLQAVNPENAPRVEKFQGGRAEEPSIIRPGSGDQAPYAYVPKEQIVDPLAPVIAPTAQGAGNKFRGFAPDENEIAKRIDFGNEAATEARKNQRYLLNDFWKRLKYRTLDFLQPVKEVGKESYDLANKFLRVNIRQQAAIDDALYIPNPDGTYTRGAESLAPMVRALDADPEKLARFQIYAQARQATSGTLTPFEGEAALSIVNRYAKDHPEIVQVYENMYLPFINDMRKMYDGYNLTSQQAIIGMLQNPEYAPLMRSVFSDEPIGLQALKKRVNPESEKFVEDMWQSLMDNVRGVVRAGERAKVLRSLADERMKNPKALEGVIEIVEPRKPEELEAFLKTIPKDTPEVIKQALEEAFMTRPSRNVYNVRIGDKKVGIQIIDPQLKASLDMMQSGMGRFGRNVEPVNMTGPEKLLNIPRTAATLEKTATGAYSLYRDLLGFGIPLDALEVAMNATARGYRFNPLFDPIKGFIALYKNDPVLKDLVGHGGGLGFRFADPAAETSAKTIDELVKRASASGLKLRIMNPGKALSELAGNLSNASRAGLVLRNADRPMTELATAYNNIIGDPAVAGTLLGAMSRYTGFMNFPLQATRASINAIVDNPAKLALYAARGAGMITIPTIALAAVRDQMMTPEQNRKVDELLRDPQGRRFTYIPDFNNPDEVIAIQRPQGLTGTLFSLLADQAILELKDSGNTQSLQQVLKAAQEAVTPNFLPLTANLAVGLATGRTFNTSTFAPMDVVPQGRAALLPEDAGPAGMLNASRALGQITGMDAGKWDKVFRTFLVGTSYTLAQQLDYTLGDKKGPPPKTDISLLQLAGLRKERIAGGGSRHLSEFYKELDDASAALNSFNAAINNGQPERAVQIYGQYTDRFNKAMTLQEYAKVLTKLNSEVNLIRYNEFYDKDRKRKELDDLMQLRTDIAKRGLDMIKKQGMNQ